MNRSATFTVTAAELTLINDALTILEERVAGLARAATDPAELAAWLTQHGEIVDLNRRLTKAV